jgi:hypothetical protein
MRVRKRSAEGLLHPTPFMGRVRNIYHMVDSGTVECLVRVHKRLKRLENGIWRAILRQATLDHETRYSPVLLENYTIHIMAAKRAAVLVSRTWRAIADAVRDTIH